LIISLFDEEFYSHWQTLLQFNTISDNLQWLTFWGHPVYHSAGTSNVFAWNCLLLMLQMIQFRPH